MGFFKHYDEDEDDDDEQDSDGDKKHSIYLLRKSTISKESLLRQAIIMRQGIWTIFGTLSSGIKGPGCEADHMQCRG